MGKVIANRPATAHSRALVGSGLGQEGVYYNTHPPCPFCPYICKQKEQMKITKHKLARILELLPDFDSYKEETIEFQIHETEQTVFTLPRAPLGIPVKVLVFRKNHLIRDWECDVASLLPVVI